MKYNVLSVWPNAMAEIIKAKNVTDAFINLLIFRSTNKPTFTFNTIARFELHVWRARHRNLCGVHNRLDNDIVSIKTLLMTSLFKSSHFFSWSCGQLARCTHRAAFQNTGFTSWKYCGCDIVLIIRQEKDWSAPSRGSSFSELTLSSAFVTLLASISPKSNGSVSANIMFVADP